MTAASKLDRRGRGLFGIPLDLGEEVAADLVDNHGSAIVAGFGDGKTIGPGFFRLDWAVDRENAGSACRLLFDGGSGFAAQSALPVLPARGRGAVRRGLDFHLSTPVVRLRLDHFHAGSIDPSSIRLRRLTAAEYHGRMALGAAHHFRDNGRSSGWIVRRAFHLLRQIGPLAFIAKLRDMGGASLSRRDDYERWIKDREPVISDWRRDGGGGASGQPLISVLMPVYNAPPALLKAAVESVRAQTYSNWELCMADDGSTDPALKPLLEGIAASDGRIRLVSGPNGGISAATNAALALATGSWLVPLDQDDVLAPNALAEVALEAGAHPDASIIYSDEDKITEEGVRYDPYFKPDHSPELLHSQNYFNHLTALRAEFVRAVGGWRPAFDGSQDYDMILRVLDLPQAGPVRHVPKILYHWRAHAGSTALSGGEKDYAFDAGLRALKDHLVRMGIDAEAEPARETPFYRIRHNLPHPPLVSIIIPTRDQVRLLRTCISSLVERTDYPTMEILVVDNNSAEQESLDYFSELEERGIARVLRFPHPFNYSAINNFAVRHARGSVLALLNNDIEAIAPDWLTEMVSWAVQPGVGCVGAKLYYGDGSIQHAGVVLGIGGVAGHSHKHFPRHHPGAFFRLKVIQNFSAVTGACLVVRKELYDLVGGLNEQHLTVAFNDVDFCLKVVKAGYRTVWTPYAELYHHESVSRGAEDTAEKRERFRGEVAYMLQSWKLDDDPFYSPNLTLHREDFSIGYDRALPSDTGEQAAA